MVNDATKILPSIITALPLAEAAPHGFFAKIKHIFNTCALPETVMVVGCVLGVLGTAVAVTALTLSAPLIVGIGLGVAFAGLAVFCTGKVIQALRSYRSSKSFDIDLRSLETPKRVKQSKAEQAERKAEEAGKAERKDIEKTSSKLVKKCIKLKSSLLPDAKIIKELEAMLSCVICSLEKISEVDKVSAERWKDTLKQYKELKILIQYFNKLDQKDLEIRELVSIIIDRAIKAKYASLSPLAFVHIKSHQY